MPAMLIQQLRLYPVTTARETGATNQHIIVRIESDDGCVGWGEMSDQSHLPMAQYDLRELERVLNDLLVGQEARNLLRVEEALIHPYPQESSKYSRSGSVRQG